MENNISKDVSSCAEVFTTVDGRILIDELINILEYAEKCRVNYTSKINETYITNDVGLYYLNFDNYRLV